VSESDKYGEVGFHRSGFSSKWVFIEAGFHRMLLKMTCSPNGLFIEKAGFHLLVSSSNALYNYRGWNEDSKTGIRIALAPLEAEI
jgi:hypothetical protein